MEIHKKILLILTIFIASVIIYRLWNQRIDIQTQTQIKKESFKASINLMNTHDNHLPINQYFIKASWNTAYNSSKNIMDLSMVTTVLSRGCRFIDFEVYSSSSTTGSNTYTSKAVTTIIPVIGYSVQPKNKYQMDCNEPTVSLLEALTTAKEYAFSQGTSTGPPNSKDPLFIQIRVKSANQELYDALPTAIKSGLGSAIVLPTENSFNKILLKDMAGGVYLFADLVNSDPMFKKNYEKYDIFSNITVSGFLENGISTIANSILLQSPKLPPMITDHSKMTVSYPVITYPDCSNCKPQGYIQFTESFPDISVHNTIANPTAYPPIQNKLHAGLNSDVMNMIINYGMNIIPFRFYIDDNSLADYENIFMDNGECAFVKMGLIMKNYNITPTT